MSLNMIEKALYDVSVSRRSAERFKEDTDGFLERYRLSADEVAMLRDADVGAMRALGANPMLTMGFWLIVKGRQEMGEYMKRMRAGKGRADG